MYVGRFYNTDESVNIQFIFEVVDVTYRGDYIIEVYDIYPMSGDINLFNGEGSLYLTADMTAITVDFSTIEGWVQYWFVPAA